MCNRTWSIRERRLSVLIGLLAGEGSFAPYNAIPTMTTRSHRTTFIARRSSRLQRQQGEATQDSGQGDRPADAMGKVLLLLADGIHGFLLFHDRLSQP